jgi:predicted transcriptional regulator of viral defense system
MARNSRGTLTTEQVTKAGIHRQFLKRLLEQGRLLRYGRGVYVLPEVMEDDIYYLQNRYRRGVYSHETALFLLGLTDRTPVKYRMTFPENYNTSNIDRAQITVSQIKPDQYEMGITTGLTPGGNPVRLYNAERTLCDILKTRSHTGIEIISEAFKNYMNSGKTDIPKLSAYAKTFRVESRVRAYLEVLL